MKAFSFCIVFFTLLFCNSLHAQDEKFKWGGKIGIGTANLSAEKNSLSTDSINLGIKNAKYGYYFGLFTSYKIGKIYLQPEVLFNSNRVDYTFKQISKPNLDSIRTERYNFIDLPLLVGFKLAFLRAKVGPVAHIRVNSSSELKDVVGYEEKWKTALWGYQAGISLNFTKRTHVDIRYEGNFDKWGSHIVIGNKTYTFQQGAPSRWLVNVGYAF